MLLLKMSLLYNFYYMRIIVWILFLFLSTHGVYASEVTEVRDRVIKIQAASPVWTPTAPTNMEQKGNVGYVLWTIFQATGMIKSIFISAFFDIDTTVQHNTIPRWIKATSTSEGRFAAGTIEDNGTNIGIGTGTLNNRRINVQWDINFSGELYRDGILYTPTIPADVLRTTWDQDITGIKTFISNPRIENASPTTYYLDTNNRSAMAHVNSNFFYILRGAGTWSTTWSPINGRWPLTLDLETNDARFWGEGDFLGNITATNGNLITTGARPFSTNNFNGNVSVRWDTGGWAFRYGAFGSSNTDLGGFGIYGWANTLSRYYIGTYNTDEKVSILPNGNVGIWTMNPTQKLEINGRLNLNSINPTIYFTDSDTGADSYITADSAVWSLWIVADRNNEVAGSRIGFHIDNDDVADPQMVIASNWNVGIGTSSPTRTLDVAWMVNIDQGPSYDVWIQGGWAATGNGRNLALLWYKPNDTLYINHAWEYTWGTRLEGPETIVSGNLGVGTTSPTEKLDVNGKIRMRTQTVAGDSNDTVATKGYVDSVGSSNPHTSNETGFSLTDWWDGAEGYWKADSACTLGDFKVMERFNWEPSRVGLCGCSRRGTTTVANLAKWWFCISG
jgi:hypothetical protein